MIDKIILNAGGFILNGRSELMICSFISGHKIKRASSLFSPMNKTTEKKCLRRCCLPYLYTARIGINPLF